MATRLVLFCVSFYSIFFWWVWAHSAIIVLRQCVWLDIPFCTSTDWVTPACPLQLAVGVLVVAHQSHSSESDSRPGQRILRWPWPWTGRRPPPLGGWPSLGYWKIGYCVFFNYERKDWILSLIWI